MCWLSYHRHLIEAYQETVSSTVCHQLALNLCHALRHSDDMEVSTFPHSRTAWLRSSSPHPPASADLQSTCLPPHRRLPGPPLSETAAPPLDTTSHFGNNYHYSGSHWRTVVTLSISKKLGKKSQVCTSFTVHFLLLENSIMVVLGRY